MTPLGTPTTHRFPAAASRSVGLSPPVVSSRSGASPQPGAASVPLASARRSLAFHSALCGSPSRLVRRSRSRSPSQSVDADHVPEFLSPTIGPSPVIGGHFPRARMVVVSAPVAGPSSSGASQRPHQDASGPDLQCWPCQHESQRTEDGLKAARQRFKE